MATLNTNYTLLLNNYIGNFGGVNANLRVYAKIEKQDLINNKSYVAIKEVIYASADYIYSGNNTYYLNSNIGSSGTKSSGFTFYSGETLINTVYAWVTHNNDGTFTLTGSAGFTSTVWNLGTSGNYSASLPTIPRGSTIGDLSFFNFDASLTFPITKNVDSYYDVLQIGFIKDDTNEFLELKTVEDVKDGYIWTPTEEEQNIIYSNTTTSNARRMTYYISTYTDNTKTTKVGDTNTKENTGFIRDANPTFLSFDYIDVNPDTIALTGSNSKIVNGYSTLRINNLVCNANKAATLKLVQIDDIQYNYDDNFSIDLEKWSSNKINIYVIDSRNNSTKLEVLIGINYVNYFEKVITKKSCLREGSINEESVLSFSGTWFNSSFGENNNSLNATYKYKETNTDEWIQGTTQLSLIISNNDYYYEGYVKGDTDKGFNTDKSYDIQIIVSDLLGYKETTTILIAGEPAIDIYKSNIAFGGIYDELESDYQAQFKKPTNFYSGVYKNGVEIATKEDIPNNICKELFYSDYGSNGTFNINDSVENYDFIIVSAGGFLNECLHFVMLKLKDANPAWKRQCVQMAYLNNYQMTFNISFTDNSCTIQTLAQTGWSTGARVFRVVGVKIN